MHKGFCELDKMGDKQKSKAFVTKLSLRKFMSTMKRLTKEQRKIVSSIGFDHLLYLSCDFLPRGLILYLVSNFHVGSRTLRFSDGSSFTLTPLSVNKVLGTPIGGKHIGKMVDPVLRTSIAQLTKCQGHYPTINELDNLITPELDGDFFKVVFMMYAMTTFLCPSSHDAISPDYLHILANPNEISSFDYSTAILDKLVSCIEAYNEGTTCVLGGNLLVLMIIHFEFLDCDIIPAPSKSMLPRLSIWSTSLVHEMEMMDCVCKNSLQYGKLPTKDVNSTPFAFMCKQGHVTGGKYYEQLMNFVLSICPEDHHAMVKQHLPVIMSTMFNEIMGSIEPIVIQNIMNVLRIIPTRQSLDQRHNTSIGITNTMDFPVTTNVCVDEGTSTGNEMVVRSGVSGTTVQNYVTSGIPAAYARNEDVANNMLLLPVQTDEDLDRMNEEYFNFSGLLDMQSLVKSMESVHLQSDFDLPYNSELLDSLYPQKSEIVNADHCMLSNADIISYILKEAMEDSKLRRVVADSENLADVKVNFMEIFHSRRRFTNILSRRSEDLLFNRNKRTSNTSQNDISEQCVALKKRAKMFEINEVSSTESEDSSPAANTSSFGSHDQVEPSGRISYNDTTTTPDRVGNLDCTWNEEMFERELINSTLKVEAEYLTNVMNSQFISKENRDINVSVISPNNVISSFTSTLVEKDVFNDIISRVPKTKKAKTINVVRMGTTWAEHRVFALSMMVYGNINPYVMNMLGKAVLVEDAEKENLNLLPRGYWKRYYYDYNIAALFMKACENPGILSKYLAHSMIGFKLDSRDLVHLPLFTDGFYFLLVVNFQEKVFQVLYPNNKEHLVSDNASTAINNFKMAFKIAYKHSHVDVDNMDTTFRSVCSSEKDADSGIFVMELIRHQTNGKFLCFEPKHAKPLRESLTYYMIAHPFNELMPPETKDILTKHNIPYNYKSTTGYYPWMHEQCEAQVESN